MGFRTKFLAIAASVALLGGASGAANALTLNTDGSSGTASFNWSFTTPGGLNITGTGSFAVASSTSTSLVLNISLSNTTVVSGTDNMALLSFGFGINPNASAVSISGGTTMLDASLDSIPSLASIEVCAWGGNNCNGGPVNDGIQAGGSDSFSLTLTGTWGSVTAVTIDPIGFKFQGTEGSFEFTTTTSSTTTTGTPSTSSTSGVPEPNSSSLALLGLAMLGTAFGMRRRKLNS